MRIGHRRTQSQYMPAPQLHHSRDNTTTIAPILKLVQQSQIKISDKIINYQRLQINKQQQNNYLKFGNLTLQKFNALPHSKNKSKINIYPSNLNIIPENFNHYHSFNSKNSKKDHKCQLNLLFQSNNKNKHKIISQFKQLHLQTNKKYLSDKQKSKPAPKFHSLKANKNK